MLQAGVGFSLLIKSSLAAGTALLFQKNSKQSRVFNQE
jgi:hypothetical protein